jgi:hypothetical protein
MGASWEQIGTLNAVQAGTLGLFGRSAQRSLQADGSSADVTLAPLSGASGVRALRLLGHGGRQYWIELRTADGQDGWIGTAADRFGLETGVLVRRVGDWPDTSLLLDPTPTAGGDSRTAVPAGETVRLAGGFTVTVTGADAGGATLSIASTAPAAAAEAPAGHTGGAGAPDVLPAEGQASGGTGSGAVDATAPDTAEEPQPEAATQAAVAGEADEAADTAGPAQAQAVAEPTVVPASHARSLAVPAAAATVLGGAALLVTWQLVRTRPRR